MDYSEEYAKKLATPEKAVEAVQSGQWIDYSWGVTVPVALGKALTKVMPPLHQLNIRSGMVLRIPEIFKIESPHEHFTRNAWHMTDSERSKKQRESKSKKNSNPFLSREYPSRTRTIVNRVMLKEKPWICAKSGLGSTTFATIENMRPRMLNGFYKP